MDITDLAAQLIEEGFCWGSITTDEAQEALDTVGIDGTPEQVIEAMQLLAGMRR